MRRRPALLLAALLLACPAGAVQQDEILPDAGLERRARAISAELRCLVCQNQSIDDSDAPLARDLRILVRERLKAGDSDGAVRDFVVARYGEFVLLRPPFGWRTLLLWAAPFLILAIALLALLARARRLRTADTAPVPLSAQERTRLERLLDEPPG